MKMGLKEMQLKDFVEVIITDNGDTIVRDLGFFSALTGEIAWFKPQYDTDSCDVEPEIEILTQEQLVNRIRSFKAKILKGDITPDTPAGTYLLANS